MRPALMSALVRKRTNYCGATHVRFLPTADIVLLMRSEMTEAANQAAKA